MNAFFYPSKRGINFAKIRGFKFTDYNSLIRRRYGGGVGNRRRWADRFAMSEQRLQVGSKEDVHLYE